MIELALLRDPDNGAPVALAGDHLKSEAGRRFPIIDGVPVLLPESSLFGVPDGRREQARGLKARARQLRPRATLALGSAARYARLVELLRPIASARVLVLGGGQRGQGMKPLLAAPGITLVESDVYIGPHTTVVCDAHQLPFGDHVFDAVVAQAVLEHVADPAVVVAEATRVLKLEGLIYSEIPFMQQVHEGAYDFTRFTLSGHRRLLRRFDELDAGVLSGPGAALAWSFRYFLRSLPKRSTRVRASFDLAARLMTWWLPQLDRWLIHHPGAEDAACATYFLGRRRATASSDAAIVERYSGAQRRAPR